MNTLDPPKNAIELAMFWTWMGADGVCRTKAKHGVEILLQHAQENSLAVNSFYTTQKYPLLVDARDITYISREARQQFAIHGRESAVCCFALLVKSPLSRVIGNFFIGLNKPTVPARLFDSEHEALSWLKNQF